MRTNGAWAAGILFSFLLILFILFSPLDAGTKQISLDSINSRLAAKGGSTGEFIVNFK